MGQPAGRLPPFSGRAEAAIPSPVTPPAAPGTRVTASAAPAARSGIRAPASGGGSVCGAAGRSQGRRSGIGVPPTGLDYRRPAGDTLEKPGPNHPPLPPPPPGRFRQPAAPVTRRCLRARGLASRPRDEVPAKGAGDSPHAPVSALHSAGASSSARTSARLPSAASRRVTSASSTPPSGGSSVPPLPGQRGSRVGRVDARDILEAFLQAAERPAEQLDLAAVDRALLSVVPRRKKVRLADTPDLLSAFLTFAGTRGLKDAADLAHRAADKGRQLTQEDELQRHGRRGDGPWQSRDTPADLARPQRGAKTPSRHRSGFPTRERARVRYRLSLEPPPSPTRLRAHTASSGAKSGSGGRSYAMRRS